MEYFVVKWLHVLASTLLFGTGIGSAFYMLFVSLEADDAKTVAFVARNVVRADWLFTATSAVFQPISGLYLVHLAGYPLASRWIVGSLALYVGALACWLPVVWIQIQMRNLAEQAGAEAQPLPRRYWQYLRLWTLLGTVAFVAFVAIFWLMVAKPF